MLTAEIPATKPSKGSRSYFAPHRYCESKRQFPLIDCICFFTIEAVLVIAKCGKQKRNGSFLVGLMRRCCGCLWSFVGSLLVVCSCLPVVCSHLLVVCCCLLVVCDCLCLFVVVYARLWLLHVLFITISASIPQHTSKHLLMCTFYKNRTYNWHI